MDGCSSEKVSRGQEMRGAEKGEERTVENPGGKKRGPEIR